ALRHGGFRVAHTGTDVFAYWRETEEERLLVMVRRRPGQPVRVEGLQDATNVYGGAELAVSGDAATLPTDGPTVQVWACD
ncbi:MAG TPA: glycoside hydrolase family 13 protein, partial [Micromonosporaceae bacterium]|nr:glycoside hydrolase family 13 protein [Micromonosporaceae bacterium]